VKKSFADSDSTSSGIIKGPTIRTRSYSVPIGSVKSRFICVEPIKKLLLSLGRVAVKLSSENMRTSIIHIVGSAGVNLGGVNTSLRRFLPNILIIFDISLPSTVHIKFRFRL
jgi:hypothetical protein